MSGEKWSPEPWSVEDRRGWPGRRTRREHVLDRDGLYVAGLGTHPANAANAARIVSCVNALRGVPSPEAAVERAVEALKALTDEPWGFLTSDGECGYCREGLHRGDYQGGHKPDCAVEIARAALSLLRPGEGGDAE